MLRGPRVLGGPQYIREMTMKCWESRHSNNRKQVLLKQSSSITPHWVSPLTLPGLVLVAEPFRFQQEIAEERGGEHWLITPLITEVNECLSLLPREFKRASCPFSFQNHLSALYLLSENHSYLSLRFTSLRRGPQSSFLLFILFFTLLAWCTK